MDFKIDDCPNLTPQDVVRIRAVEAGMFITADVVRADLLLCCLIKPDQALVVRHAIPTSISSLYREDATGTVFTEAEQPLLLRVLRGGRGDRQQREVKGSRAPIIQHVYPVTNDQDEVIGALVVEINMFARERHRRRSKTFQHAVSCMLHMCARGDLQCGDLMTRFGLYDGIYLVDRNRTILYMSGIAGNLFRSIGLTLDLRGQPVADLEDLDEEMVDEVLRTGGCTEERQETPNGRVWVRKALPLQLSAAPLPFLPLQRPWQYFRRRNGSEIDGVMVLLHNATEAVQKERELNVKSAIIQEVHHRVKNNLQTIAAILRIQARRSESEEASQQLTEAVNRILSVAMIHEFLSEDEHQPINIRDLTHRIAEQVRQVAGNPDQRIEIKIQGPNIRLPAGQATPVAMVINELVLNAMEHGLSGQEEGWIEIELRDLGDSVRVIVQNSGRGLPPGFDPQENRSLGLQIVHTLVTDDMKGDVKIESLHVDNSPDGSQVDGQHPEAEGAGRPYPAGSRTRGGNFPQTSSEG